MTEPFIKSILDKIQKTYGIYVNFAHEGYMNTFITQRAESLNLSIADYCSLVERSDEELTLLTDEAAINETYFFREEKQFDFLKDYLFLEHQSLNVWCTSCSSGEEPLSIYSLAKYCGKDIQIFASDIDTKALSFFRNGVYSKHSFRGDGEKYHHVLKRLCTEVEDSETYMTAYQLAQEDLSRINIFRHNLVAEPDYTFPIMPGTLDLILIRNVFIYFDEKDREFILKKLTNYLKPGGIILFAMSEIASISGAAVPALKKENLNSVYYFRKLMPGEKSDTKPLARTFISNYVADTYQEPKLQNFYKNDIENVSESTDYVNKLEVLLEKKNRTLEQKFEAVSKTQGKASSIDLEESVKQFLSLIERKDFVQSRKLLDEMSFRADNLEFKFYLNGIFYKEAGKIGEAEEYFVKAGFSKPHFWPSKYQLGLLYHGEGRIQDMKTVFSDCVKDLLEYTESQSKTYSFLFGDFDSSYILELCYSYLYKKG